MNCELWIITLNEALIKPQTVTQIVANHNSHGNSDYSQNKNTELVQKTSTVNWKSTIIKNSEPRNRLIDEPLLAHPIVVVHLTDVTTSVIVKEDYNNGIIGKLIFHLANDPKC